MNKKTILVGISLFALMALATLAVFMLVTPPSFRGATFGEPYPPAPEIELTRSDGSRFQLSQMRDQVVLLFFGYTSCPDVCPTTLAELNRALSQLDEGDAAQVTVVFVTVDPDRDTPEQVQEYVSQFNHAFIGLSGSLTELEKIWQGYGVYREIVGDVSAAGYEVDHTARVTLIDQHGDMRVTFGLDTPVDDMVHDLKIILSQR